MLLLLPTLTAGPVLLVPSTGLTAAIKTELARLNPGKVFLVGLPDSLIAQVKSIPGFAGGGTNISADAFDIVGALPSGATTLTRYEQTDPRLAYAGTWQSNTSSPTASGGSFRYADSAGSSVTLRFVGTYLAWIAKTSSVYGIAKVTVDGTVAASVDLYSADPSLNHKVWDTGTLSSGLHTVKIEWTGDRAAGATDANISVDAFDVRGSLAGTTTTPNRYEQSDSRLVYAGSWQSMTDAAASGGSFLYANTTGSSVTVTFVGTKLTWIAKQSPSYGRANVTVDGGAPAHVNLFSSATHLNQKVWDTGTLTPGTHTVVIEWTGAPTPGANKTVTVLRGADAYATAAKVATQIKTKLGSVGGVVIVPGDSYADALAAAPLAAAKGWPILLTPAAGPFPTSSAQALTDLGVAHGVVVGTNVNPGAGFTVNKRIIGADRYDTCAQVATFEKAHGLSVSRLAFVSIDTFGPGLAAGAYVAKDHSILLFTQTTVPTSISSFVKANAAAVTKVDCVSLSSAATGSLFLIFPFPAGPPGSTYLKLQLDSPLAGTAAYKAQVQWLEQKLVTLSYKPGPVNGEFNMKTYQAVLAFQKVQGLGRDGIVGNQVWASILVAKVPTPRLSYSGTRLEVSISKQVLFYIHNNVVVKTIPVSTGKPGWETKPGSYAIGGKLTGWVVGPLGPMYWPCYVYPHHYVHGSTSVPPWPASHGCIRTTTWDMDALWPQLFGGMRVNIYY